MRNFEYDKVYCCKATGDYIFLERGVNLDTDKFGEDLGVPHVVKFTDHGIEFGDVASLEDKHVCEVSPSDVPLWVDLVRLYCGAFELVSEEYTKQNTKFIDVFKEVETCDLAAHDGICSYFEFVCECYYAMLTGGHRISEDYEIDLDAVFEKCSSTHAVVIQRFVHRILNTLDALAAFSGCGKPVSLEERAQYVKLIDFLVALKNGCSVDLSAIEALAFAEVLAKRTGRPSDFPDLGFRLSTEQSELKAVTAWSN